MVKIMMKYMQRQSAYKVHLNTIVFGELSDPLCDSVNRGLTLVRLSMVELDLVTLKKLKCEKIWMEWTFKQTDSQIDNKQEVFSKSQFSF